MVDGWGFVVRFLGEEEGVGNKIVGFWRRVGVVECEGECDGVMLWVRRWDRVCVLMMVECR